MTQCKVVELTSCLHLQRKGGNIFLTNKSIHILEYVALHSRRTQSKYSSM